MYAGDRYQKHPDRAAFIMASTGETVTYAELERRTNRVAHALRAEGLKRLDHVSIFMENNNRYLECNGAGERTGLYYTCINSYLTADEVAYILNNSESQVLITSAAKFAVARAAIASCPRIKRCLVVDGGEQVRALHDERIVDFVDAISKYPDTPIDDERLGTPMLYSSGTTGRPKGVVRPLPDQHPSKPLPLFNFINGPTMFACEEAMVYLSPAPLYHSAPQTHCSLVIRNGGTVVIMEKFDPENYLALVEKYKIGHTQLVPTMFNRMLKLPAEVRGKYDLSSLRQVVHAAAPCPADVKDRMIEWWGPIIFEYYGATEGFGFTACNTKDWLAHRGSVGKVIFGDMHILDKDMKPSPKGEPGEVWFKLASEFAYFNDPERTQESRSADGSMATVGDVGYVEDGYLYLTDRSTFMIISGGVNIYPQECENLLVTHPQVADAAVFGIPNEDMGEEVKAVIQPMPGVKADDAFAQSLIAYCAERLASMKIPRTIDFIEEMPRLPTGKLYKNPLRDPYWKGRGKSRIV